MREITYAEAIREALKQEMQRDPNVFLLGEDIGAYGGAFKVLKGMLDEFGPERVRDTPISEAAIVGAAIGAALMGLRPIAEIMYMDFLPIATEQLVVQAAKMSFTSGGKLRVPIVIRTQYSLGRAHASQHSEFFPVWYMNVPGLKVALPSTPYDAKGMLISAIRDDNPVLFIECGLLYRNKGSVPEEPYEVPLGSADVKREGEDVTVVAVSRMVVEALKAAEELQKEGISVEVVDPRTLSPLDRKTITDSVKKTGRAVVAADDHKTGGVTAELTATIVEGAFDYLDAPIVRVASPDVPIPFSPPLEKQYMVWSDDIVKAVKEIV
ncbi:MAG: alpha-ketoacid dehydrogenase subunit beta [Thermoproteota archaeon]|nr:MAG: alpha-ketoacid dehydrogenase subunit beta [Candidatus Korarchaeota archaeon]